MRRIIAILVFLTAYPLFSQEKNDQFTVHDFLAMTQISSPQFAPNGKNIACVIGKKESWDAARVNNIWIIAADGSEEKQITNSEKADWNPRWSPDGSKIAFMSTRSGKTQVYIIPIDGGEAQRITWCEEGVNIYDWIGNNRIFLR